MIALRIVQTTLGCCVIVIALAVITGFFSGMPLLEAPVMTATGIIPNPYGMAPTTAICLVMLAICVILSTLKGTHTK